jgi:nicotinate-nucleotide adenylyltransferase
MSTSVRLGILGGTFDPIHYAHLAIAEEARTQQALEPVIFVPAGQPPHKPDMAITPPHHRLAMLELALASNPHFIISRVDLERPGPCYTVDTLVLLREQWGPDAELHFIIGADSLREMHTWYQPRRIVDLARLVVAPRPGTSLDLAGLTSSLPGLPDRVDIIQVPLLEISGTTLRQRVRARRSVKYYLPEEVEAYILRHGLYKEAEHR